MTTASERTRAVLMTRALLEELSQSPDYSQSLREQAAGLLRHYPSARHIDIAAAAFPDIWHATRACAEEAPTYLQLLHLVEVKELCPWRAPSA